MCTHRLITAALYPLCPNKDYTCRKTSMEVHDGGDPTANTERERERERKEGEKDREREREGERVGEREKDSERETEEERVGEREKERVGEKGNKKTTLY